MGAKGKNGCLKWFIGFLFLISMSTMSYMFIFSKISEKETVFSAVKPSMLDLLAKNGKTTDLPFKIRKALAYTEKYEIIPKSDIYLTYDDIKDLKDDEMIDYIGTKVLTHFYSTKISELIKSMEGEEELENFKKEMSVFAPLLDKSFEDFHKGMYKRFIIFEVASIIFLLLLLVLNHRFGKLVGPGIIMVLTAGTKFGWIALIKTQGLNSTDADISKLFSNEAVQGAITSIYNFHLYILIAGAAMIVIAIIGAIIHSVSGGDSNSSNQNWQRTNPKG